LSVLINGSLKAQTQVTDTKAKLILNQTSLKYRSIKALMVSFTFTLFSPQDHVTQSHTGSLWVKPGSNHYRILTGDQEQICDGKDTYSYLKKQKEVQISKFDSTAQTLNPAKAFTLYEKGYSYVFREVVVEKNRKLDVIDLVPLIQKTIFKASVYIDQKSKMIHRIKTFNKNGDQMIYTINSYSINPAIKESYFNFDKKNYPGAEIVDLR
jgi:outer membrane lipoprotein-sorting protein